jgi:tetratricopeptide (TPR) repeat protein
MSTEMMTQHDQGRRFVIAVLGLGLAFLFIASILYRVQNPSLTMQARQDQQAAVMSKIAELMAGLDKEPNHLPTLMTLGDLFMRIGSWEQAAVFWKRALAVDPAQGQALNGLGVAYYNLDKFFESAEQFERMIALLPDNYRAHFNLGMLYKHYLDQPQRARTYFERVLELNPADEAELIRRVQAELAEAGAPTPGQ